MESTRRGSSLPPGIHTNNRPGETSRGSSREITAPPVAKSGRDRVFKYDVLTCKEKIVQNFLKQSRFPHDKDDPKLQGSLKTSIYFGAPIIQHAARCIPVCRAVEKYLSMREIVALACLNSDYRLLISSLAEKYYSRSPAIRANYRSLWQSQFARPPERLTLWLERYFDKSDKAWVEADPLRQAALHRYLCSRVDTIKCVTTLPKNLGIPFCITTLPNGQIATGSFAGTLRLWDLNKTGEKLCGVTTLSGHTDPISYISMLTDELIISAAHELRIWDLTRPEGEQCVATLQGHTKWVECIAMLPDRQIVSCSSDHTLRVWDLSKPVGEECVAILSEHTGGINCIAIHPNGQIISCSDDCTLRVWDLNGPERDRCVATLRGHTDGVNSIVLLTDRRIISCSEDTTLRVWDLSKPAGKRCVAILSGHTDGVNSIALLTDEKIISCSDDSTLRVWDLNKPERDRCVATLHGHTRAVNCIAVLANGQVITGSKDLTLRIWDLSRPEGEQCVAIRPGDFVELISMHPDGWIITDSGECHGKVLDQSASIDINRGLSPNQRARKPMNKPRSQGGDLVMPGIAIAIAGFVPGFSIPAEESDTQTSDNSSQESEEPEEDNEEGDSWHRLCQIS